MRVFCSECKYCKISHRPINIWEDKILCKKHITNIDNFYCPNLRYEECKDINIISQLRTP